MRYLVALRGHFELLVKNPEIGKPRNEIKKGLHSVPHAALIIFYRIFTSHIRVVRELRGSKDLIKFL